MVAAMCRTFQAACKARGIEIIFTSTLRPAAEQFAYYAQGRKELKFVNQARQQAGLGPITQKDNLRIITKNIISIHEFGCAFDCAVVKKGAVIWEIKADVNANNIPDYEEIGKIGEAIGFRWGGRFQFRDYVHFEYTAGLTLADLQAGKRPTNIKQG